MSSDIVCKCATNLSDPVLNKIKEVYNYIKHYEESVNKLQEAVDGLTRHWNDINEKVKQGKLKGEVLNEVADNWLQLVDKLNKDKKLKKLMDEGYRKQKDQCCFGTCHINPFYRYKCSKEAKVKTESIQHRINDVPKEAVTRPQSSAEVKSIIDGYKQCGSDYLESRSELLDKVFRKFGNKHVKFIAIYGEEAVGKTRLVKDIFRIFDLMLEDIVTCHTVEIGRADDIKHIQDQMKRYGLIGDETIEERGEKVKDSQSEHKIIIICLDSIWEKIDLDRVGIPKGPNYKILMVSRKKSVLKEMGVDDSNMFELGRLSKDEARNLFWAKVSFKENTIISGDYLSVAEKLVSKCGGLPLAVVTLAGVLSGNTLLYWERFAAKLEIRPASIGISSSQQQLGGGRRDDDHEYFSILETSYLLLSAQERMMFLLCSLFPRGQALVQELIMCAIGLGLVEWVNTLFEAGDMVKNWIGRLISSTLVEDLTDQLNLLDRSLVKVPDLVRRYGISLLAKDLHLVMVEGFPRWMSLESCATFYAISMTSSSNHSRLSKLHPNNHLRILILDESEPRHEFEDTFFQGMGNLKVLVLRGMKFKLKLPSSMRNLKSSLTTLIMEKCELGDIAEIGELTNLVVLSLSGSSMEEIPEAIGHLCNLRLLDLNGCISKGGIAANVLSRLSQLEALYTFGWALWRWSNGKCEEGEHAYARIAELKDLSYLNLLHLTIEFNDWPIHDEDEKFLKNLDHFRICIGSRELHLRKYSRALQFDNNNKGSIVKYDSGRVLLETTQFLRVNEMSELKHVFEIDDIEAEEDKTKMQLSNIHFPHLQHLYVQSCPKMQSLSSTPFNAPELTCLQVNNCNNMKHIFLEYDADHLVNAQCLKLMELESLLELESVTGFIKRPTTTNDDHQHGHHILFNHKTIFPSLECLKMKSCDKIVQLWEVNCKEMMSYFYSSFKNLHRLEIEKCFRLETLGSIRECPLVRQVISSEAEKGIKTPISGDEIFPLLDRVELKDCPNLKMLISISGEDLKDQILKLPSLQDLKIENCPGMRSLLIKRPTTTNDDQQPRHHILFNHKMIIFPSLEGLSLEDSFDEIVQLWEVNCKEMSYYSSFNNLHHLHIEGCKKLETLGSLLIATALVKLKRISIRSCPLLREVISFKEEEGIKAPISADKIFPTLKIVKLRRCLELKTFISIPGKVFKDQVLRLSSLQKLIIDRCPEMRLFSFGPHLKAPNLKQITYDGNNHAADETTDINSFLRSSQ